MLLYCKDKECALRHADNLWFAMDEKKQRSILWEIPTQYRMDYFLKAINDAAHVYVALDDQSYLPLAIAWFAGHLGNTRTGAMHFACNTNAQELWQASSGLMQLVRTYYDCVYCFIPMHFIGARKIADKFQFQLREVFPKVCYIADKDRSINAGLYVWKG